jgi:hypothetical protein
LSTSFLERLSLSGFNFFQKKVAKNLQNWERFVLPVAQACAAEPSKTPPLNGHRNFLEATARFRLHDFLRTKNF